MFSRTVFSHRQRQRSITNGSNFMGVGLLSRQSYAHPPNIPPMTERNSTRRVRVGNVTVGDHQPIVVQSMCATHTQDVEATAAQAEALREAGAGIVRIAVDSRKDVQALA